MGKKKYNYSIQEYVRKIRELQDDINELIKGDFYELARPLIMEKCELEKQLTTLRWEADQIKKKLKI